jgi:hypothetical protein
MISRSRYTSDPRAGDERQPEKRVPSLACRVGRRTSCRRLLFDHSRRVFLTNSVASRASALSGIAIPAILVGTALM